MSKPAKTEYLIAQFMRDPFRREARNIGVIVLRNRESFAQFVGETEPGQIDGRKVQWVEHTDIYKHWVDFWREQATMHSRKSLTTRLMAHNSGNYIITRGGELTDTGEDTLGQICRFLYASLVSTQEPVSIPIEDDSESSGKQLKQDMFKEFKKLGIMAGTAGEGVKHPVVADTAILGKATSHIPACYQLNGSLWVMEPVNFAIKHKLLARDHAGYAASMFQDILARQHNASPVAIVQGSDEDLDNEPVQKILPLLAEHAKVVRWNDQSQRSEFLQERAAVAAG